nr:hypothetical protein [Rhizobium sp. BK650]
MWNLLRISLTRRLKLRRSGTVLLFGLAFGLLVAEASAAMSQTNTSDQRPKCQADSRSPTDNDRQTEEGGSESKISRCKGVLTPPPTGDREMVEPAPPTGDMPVIRPGDTPQQVPKQQ